MPGRDGDTATIRRGPGGRTPASIAARLTYENVTHRYGDVVSVRDFLNGHAVRAGDRFLPADTTT